jgi:hypothetical protein
VLARKLPSKLKACLIHVGFAYFAIPVTALANARAAARSMVIRMPIARDSLTIASAIGRSVPCGDVSDGSMTNLPRALSIACRTSADRAEVCRSRSNARSNPLRVTAPKTAMAKRVATEAVDFLRILCREISHFKAKCRCCRVDSIEINDAGAG